MAVASSAAAPCPGDNGAESTNTVADGPVKIGFSQATQQSPFYVALTDAAQSRGPGAGQRVLLRRRQRRCDQTEQRRPGPDHPRHQRAGDQPGRPEGRHAVPRRPREGRGHQGRSPSTGPLNRARRRSSAATTRPWASWSARQPPRPLGLVRGQDHPDPGRCRGRGGPRSPGRIPGRRIAPSPNIAVVDGPYRDYIRSKAVTAMQDLAAGPTPISRRSTPRTTTWRWAPCRYSPRTTATTSRFSEWTA